MTIAVNWIRQVGQSRELVCATDSRLRFGGHWDCGPKAFPTARGDSAIMFAGDTMYAYPIVLHVLAAIAQHPKLTSRALDLPSLKGHLIRVLNKAVAMVEDLPKGSDPTPTVEFIFCGFDWRTHDFQSWLIHYDRSINAFTHRKSQKWRGRNDSKTLTLSGNYQKEFKEKLIELLRTRKKLTSGSFDMEPFEVLRDMIREGTNSHIGGAPQLLKVYPHLNCKPHCVTWPADEAKNRSLGGRILLDYESHRYLTIDPDSLNITEP